jgi:glucosyl-dolichyl phosphate glucuronosyltransferase
MNITVILCTYNRCQSLAKALASVARSVMPESVDWDVLVVDNNSKDQTRKVVEEFRSQFSARFSYLFEPQPGKSFALNSGIRNAKADVLAFIDDDVEVEAQWLHNLTKSLHGGPWSGAGGRILPETGFKPPRWMEMNDHYALAPLAIFDRGSAAGELLEAPFGTNMAFRSEMFSKHGGFRTDLGPLPNSDIRHNEDSEFGSRLLAGGERFWYEPSAVVYHAMPAERIRQEHFLAWWFDKARADFRQDGIPNDLKKRVAGVPIILVARLCAWSLRWLCTLDPARRFSCKLSVWRNAGMIRECRRQARWNPSLAPTSTPKVL